MYSTRETWAAVSPKRSFIDGHDWERFSLENTEPVNTRFVTCMVTNGFYHCPSIWIEVWNDTHAKNNGVYFNQMTHRVVVANCVWRQPHTCFKQASWCVYMLNGFLFKIISNHLQTVWMSVFSLCDKVYFSVEPSTLNRRLINYSALWPYNNPLE